MTLGKKFNWLPKHDREEDHEGTQHRVELSDAFLHRVEKKMNKTQLVEMDHVVIFPMTR
jgi:hypothetical protein